MDTCESNWQAVAIDVHGPFEDTSSGNQYVITATDRQTKWIEAEALKNTNAQDISKFLLNTFARLGFCKYRFSSCTPELFAEITNEVKTMGEGLLPDEMQWERLLELQETEEPDTSEETGENISDYLKQRIIAEGAEWDKHLYKILFNLRSSGVAGIAFSSPFQMPCVRPQNSGSSGAVNGHSASSSPKKRKRKSGRPKKLNLQKLVFEDQEPDVEKEIKKKPAARRLASTTKRQPYGLRMTLKSKAKSSVVNRMLSKSRIKRALESGEEIPDTIETEKPEKRKPPRTARKVTRKNAIKKVKVESAEVVENATESPDVADEVKNEAEDVVDEEMDEDDVDLDDDDDEFFVEDDGANDDDPSFSADGMDDGEVGGGNKRKRRTKRKTKEKKSKVEKKGKKVKVVVEKKEKKKRMPLSEEQMEELKGWDPMTCPQCPDVGFISRQELDMHIAFHKEGTSTLYCVHCDRQDMDWVDMQMHLTEHTEVSISLTLPIECFTCKECFKVLDNIDNVERHLQAFHRHRPVSVCKTCGMQFRSHRRHVAHLGVHTGLLYQCTKCRFHTKTFCALAEHQVVHQGCGVQCTNCSKVFPSMFHMKDHQKVHKRMEDLNICEFCGKQIYGTGAMRHHIRYFHSDAEQFPCPLCQYVGRTKSNLRGHTDRIHKKPYKCSECDYACLAERTLQKHIDMFHNPGDRHYPCMLCPYRGRDNKTLAEHFRIRHKSSEGFCCPTCHVVFKTRTLLRDHMPTHTGARAYLCKLCDYTAKYRPTMYRHVMNKHPGYTLSTAVNVSGRESTARVSGGRTGTRKGKANAQKVEIEKIEAVVQQEYIFQEQPENEEEGLVSAVEDSHAVSGIPDGNMVAIMDANLLAEMAASGQVCVQYIDSVGGNVGEMETVEVGTLHAESMKDVKEKYQMLATGLTFSCL